MAMRQEDQDKLATKLAELARHIKTTKRLAAALQETADRNVECYTWLATKLGAAQVHFSAGEADIANGQAGPPPKPPND